MDFLVVANGFSVFFQMLDDPKRARLGRSTRPTCSARSRGSSKRTLTRPSSRSRRGNPSIAFRSRNSARCLRWCAAVGSALGP
jgi:hypothetical protein